MNNLATVEQSAPVKLPILAGGKVAAIIPRSVDEAFRLAEAFCIAGMVPDSYKGKDNRETASRVMMGIMKGAEVGLPPVTALSNIYIVNNRPSIFGDGALALVQARDDYAGCREWLTGTPETDGYTAHCEVKRRTAAGEIISTERQFSWGEAKRAALIGRGPWRQYPQRMLQMRARSWAIRDSYSDALSGLHIAEEVQDIAVKPEVVDTGFLDAGESATDWPNTARLLGDAVANLATEEALDAFLDASELQRAAMKDEAPELWKKLDDAINVKTTELSK